MAESNLDLHAKARREVARAAGIALIQMSSAFDQNLGVVTGVGGVTFALVAFAARARRLLRSAYRLIDAGERDAAVPLYRVMNEYLIVGRWLIDAGDEELRLWALDDLRGRLTLVRGVIADPNLDDETKATLAQELARIEEAIRNYGGDDTPTTKRSARNAGAEVPSLEAMAKKAGLSFVYVYPYRLMSQTDVHATPTAIDSAFEADGERGQTVRPVPRFALEGYDSYLVGAHILLDILTPLVERIPQLGWEGTTAMVTDVLSAIGRADPDSRQLTSNSSGER